MNTGPNDLLDVVMSEITGVAEKVDRAQVESLATALTAADRIFVTGEGRSGFMARAFAMRLMHLGLPVFVLGETTTPAVTGNRHPCRRIWFRHNGQHRPGRRAGRCAGRRGVCDHHRSVITARRDRSRSSGHPGGDEVPPGR